MFPFDVTRYVPRFLLEDKNGYAVAKAIEAAVQIMNDTIRQGVDCIANYDTMPEWRLDELAWEYNVAWYDPEGTVDARRGQISGATSYYMRIGTHAAVRRAISDVYGAGRVEEWFQYGGEPYHFNVYATSEEILTNQPRFLRLLDQVKNVRSVLDQIYYYGESGAATLRAGTKATAVTGAWHGFAPVIEEE